METPQGISTNNKEVLKSGSLPTSKEKHLLVLGAFCMTISRF